MHSIVITRNPTNLHSVALMRHKQIDIPHHKNWYPILLDDISMLEGNSNLQIYEMTPIGLHLCDGMHYLCIQTLMNKLQNTHYPWPHTCIE